MAKKNESGIIQKNDYDPLPAAPPPFGHPSPSHSDPHRVH